MPRGSLVAAHALPDAALALCRIMPPRQRGGFFHEEPPHAGPAPLAQNAGGSCKGVYSQRQQTCGQRRGAENEKNEKKDAHAKKALARGRKSLILMVGRAGIEPATLCLKGRYSTY